MTPKQQLGTDLLAAYKAEELSDSCLYTSSDGKHCAIGWLLGDELTKDFAGRGWNGLRVHHLCDVSGPVSERLATIGLTTEDADQIQAAFDSAVFFTEPGQRSASFEGIVAKVFGLRSGAFQLADEIKSLESTDD